MALLISGFEGLGDADFDVYRQACWSSNLHNLDRMRTKARVVALLERIRAAVADAGLVVGSSSEIPSVWNGRTVKDQWAYLLRAEEARRQLQPVMARSTDLATKVKDPAEHHQHVVLALRLDHEGLEVGLRIHPHATVDLANLEGHAQSDPAGLVSALAGVADLVLGDGRPANATGLLAATRAARQGSTEGPWVVVARRMPRAEVVAAGANIADQVVATALALLPLFRFAAWTPENDHVGVVQQVAALAEEIEQKRGVAEAEREAAEAEREARRQEARERTEAQVAELRAWKASLRARRDEQAAERAEREAQERVQREAHEAERAAQQAERAAQQAERDAVRAAEDAARAAELAERIARARRDAQEAVKAAEARKAAAEARKAEPRKAEPRKAEPRKAEPRKAEPRQAEPRRAAPVGATPPERREHAPEARPAEAARPDDARRALAVGDRCRLDRGLLAGKEGVVRAIDAKKGYYQVRVGALDVNIAFADASPVG